MEPNKLAWRIPQAAERTGLSASFIRKLIANGQLPIAKVGRATLILDSDLRRLITQQVGVHQVTPLSAEQREQRARKRD
jgi:excisionase family DNA binding protein